MFNYLNKFKVVAFAVILAFSFISTGCSVDYRHEVEAEGSESKYQYGAGGFIRYDGYTSSEGKGIAGDFEVAVVDFKKPDSNVTIRFAGVVHIGDEEYYKTLQRLSLSNCSVVLFEGVKVKGQEDKTQTKSLHKLYDSIGKILGTGSQMSSIDYTAENFVHCDVTIDPDTGPLSGQGSPLQVDQALNFLEPIVMVKDLISATQNGQRIEDGLKHGMAGMMISQINEMTEGELFDHYRRKDGTLPKSVHDQAEKAVKKVKKALPGFPGLGGGMDEETKRFIIDERNDYVVARLTELLDTLDHSKPQTIAIFYGAGHGPGMSKGIRNLGFYASETTWYRAWAMNSRGNGYVSSRISHEVK